MSDLEAELASAREVAAYVERELGRVAEELKIANAALELRRAVSTETAKRVLDMLRAVEWSGAGGQGDVCCPWCGADAYPEERRAHAGCDLAKLITEIEAFLSGEQLAGEQTILTAAARRVEELESDAAAREEIIATLTRELAEAAEEAAENAELRAGTVTS